MTNVVARSRYESNRSPGPCAIGLLIRTVYEFDRFDHEALSRAAGAHREAGDRPTPALPEPKSPSIGHRSSQKHLQREQRNAVVAAYNDGRTVYEVAERYGIHRTTVARLVRKAGDGMRRTGLASTDVTLAAKLYKDGASLEQIAQRFGVSRGNVRTHLVAYGVQIRTRR